MRKFLLLLAGYLFASLSLVAQSKNVTGKVSDDQGNPVANASVMVKSSNIGTTTKNDGTFSITVPSTAKTLVISAVGMTAQEINISNQTQINVNLKSVDQSMQEVVVVAYGTAKKEAITGSVGQVKAEQIQKRPINNVTTALEGSMPGVVVTSPNGQPGSGLNIRIRGFGSINASQEPLLVVDGVPYVGGTSNLNPEDVESMTVLKDAASTALYGSRAANGVVMITTKRGKQGRNNIQVKIMQGVATRGLPEYERLNASQYYPVMWEAYRNSLVYPTSGTPIPIDTANALASGLYPRFTSGSNAGLQNYQGKAYSDIGQLLAYNPFNVPRTSIVGVNGQLNPSAQLLYADDLDWTKDLMRNGPRKDYSINFNGGADKVDYFFSMGYVNESGYTLNTDFERYNTRLNVNVQPKSWLKTGLNISGNYTVSNTARDGGSTNFVNPFFFSRNIGPIYPVYAHNMTTGAYVLDPNGQKIYDLGNMANTALGIANGIPNRTSGGFAGRHGLAETALNEQLFKRTAVSARNYVDILFNKNFKFTNNLSIDYQTQNDNSFENTLVGDGAPAGRSQRASGSTQAFIASQILSYGQTFGDHRVDALAGHESYNQTDNDVNGFKQGQSLTGNTELGNFTTINSVGSSLDKYRVESYFGRVNYDFQSKYFLSGSVRTDGNSRFSSESRWGTFWSVGAGWSINKEKFLENVKWINNLKLRTSYGAVGNADGIGFYAYQGLYVFANNANEPGIVQSQTAFLNRDLTWESNGQFDIGADFTLFNGRLTGTVEYYNRKTSDLLFAVPQPLSSGALTVNQNTATMYNKGIETQLSGDIVKTKDFTLNLFVNASTVTNKITKMPATVQEFVTGTKKYTVGHSLFDYWLRTYYGVDPADGAALYVPDNTSITANRRIIVNKSGGNDTVTTNIANGKFEYNGTTIPDLYGSFGTSVSYKGVTLTALFTFQVGGKTYDGLYQSLMSVSNYGGALSTDILKRWQKPGDITDVPRMDAGRATDFNATSSRWLVDASYLNIRSLNLAYNLPRSLVSRLSLSSTQFFISAENVAFFSKRKGMNNQQAFSGVTSNAYPPARVISGGLIVNL